MADNDLKYVLPDVRLDVFKKDGKTFNDTWYYFFLSLAVKVGVNDFSNFLTIFSLINIHQLDIAGATELLAADPDNDFLIIYDTSTGINKKVTPNHLGIDASSVDLTEAFQRTWFGI